MSAPTMEQIRNQLGSLAASLEQHRSVLTVCRAALDTDEDGIAQDVAVALDDHIAVRLNEEIKTLQKLIADIPEAHP
jgi:hypothetical protein